MQSKKLTDLACDAIAVFTIAALKQTPAIADGGDIVAKAQKTRSILDPIVWEETRRTRQHGNRTAQECLQ